MILNVEIFAHFSEKQNGVNTRTAEIRVYVKEKESKKLVKYFPLSAEIIRETETEETYEVDFRRMYVGRSEGRLLSLLGLQRFRKYGDDKELEIEI